MKKTNTGHIIRTAVLAAALLNQILTIAGCDQLPFDEDQVDHAVSMVLTTAAALWSWWKSNNFMEEKD